MKTSLLKSLSISSSITEPEIPSTRTHFTIIATCAGNYWLITQLTTLCHCPFRIKYDIIGKFETFAEDTRYIIIKSGAQEIIDPFDDALTWFLNRPHTATNKEAALPFFRGLRKDTILKLYLKYEMDFEMFGYSASEFYEEGLE